MARAKTSKNLIEKLQDAGEEAMAKVADAPGVGRFVESASGVKERLDDLATKVRGLEEIERRVAELERRVAELAKAQKAPAARPSAAKPRAAAAKAAPAKKKPAPRKPGAVPGP